MDYTIDDIEIIHKKFQDIIHNNNKVCKNDISDDDIEKCSKFIEYLLKNPESNLIQSKQHCGVVAIRNSVIIKYARQVYDGTVMDHIENLLRIKRGKSHSGVLVITIFTSAYPEYTNSEGEKVVKSFSCKWNCHYCPNQPDQPRSYLEGEPGVLRANANNFDCCKQMWDRMSTLKKIGHPVDKLEVLVLGGTWYSYPAEYRNQFIRDMYYAANTFLNNREKGDLEFERDANRSAKCKVIGLTLETRPDTISINNIIDARRLGCTRFQVGIQHTDDDILKKINRMCPSSKTIKAIELLKDWGYKIDCHLMPNLPFSTPDKDRKMLLDEFLGLNTKPNTIKSDIEGIHEWIVWDISHPELQVDQWKIYPCEVVPYTQIEKWHKEGSYKPYSEEELEPILLDVKRNMFPWIRLNRIIRDIPMDYIISSGDHPNTRQQLQVKMKANGWKCRCIRCREIKRQDIPDIVYRVAEYKASNGVEYFVSAEDITGDLLCGFVRIRINDTQDNAWIRELHVYGQLQKTSLTTSVGSDVATQHKGIGKKLMSFAKEIAYKHKKTSIKVISGEGTKLYYQNIGYYEGEYGYMVLDL